MRGAGRPRIVVSDAVMPVVYSSWDEWRRERRGVSAPHPVAPEPLREFCAMCWGAGRVLSPAMNGEGLVPRPCATCGGAGHA